MKITLFKILAITLIIGVFSIPVFASATVPIESSVPVAPIASGQNTGGASAVTVPNTQGQNTGGASTNQSNIPVASGQNTGGASTVTVPLASGQNTGGATPSQSNIPTASGQNTGGANAVPNAQGQNTGGATTATIPATVVIPPTETKNVSSGGGSISGGRGFVSFGSGGSLPLLTNIGQCEYISSYLKIGANNSITEVNKLQSFLRNNEELDVDITGLFDQKTLYAVNAFQTKYASDILTPWGIKSPTGHVYYTTKKKINENYCKTTFSLTLAQIAEIEAYKNSSQRDASLSNEVGVNKDSNSVSDNSDALVSDISNSTNETQTAVVVKTSLAKKLWNFIKSIFGK
ncbi:MAG TPA: hypothetical protein VJJ28_03095 [Candidatus Paceibacterota bacterium]